MIDEKGHSNIGAVLFTAFLILVIGGLLYLGLNTLAIISFIRWSTGMGVILSISALIVLFIMHWLLKKIGVI